VEWQYQRLEVERMVQHVRGVVGISNNIIVTPKVSPGQMQAKIEEAFKREAEIDARHISVAISDQTARLYGHVHSLSESERRKGSGRVSARHCQRGESFGRHTVTRRRWDGHC
jgi:osmotically-inducible protein OsmY